MSLEKYPVKRVADQVWDETAAEHIATGSMGKVSTDTSDNVLAVKAKLEGATPLEGTFSHPSGITEQTIVEVVLTKRTLVRTILIDLVNLTKGCTLRLYHKIDGTNYREVDDYAWDVAMCDGVEIDSFMTDHAFKVTIQSDEAEGASRDIPYTVNYQVMEV